MPVGFRSGAAQSTTYGFSPTQKRRIPPRACFSTAAQAPQLRRHQLRRISQFEPLNTEPSSTALARCHTSAIRYEARRHTSSSTRTHPTLAYLSISTRRHRVSNVASELARVDSVGGLLRWLHNCTQSWHTVRSILRATSPRRPRFTQPNHDISPAITSNARLHRVDALRPRLDQ